MPVRARLVACLLALLAAPAVAQSDTRSASAKAVAGTIESGDAVRPEHALGDWGGVRQRLVDRGIDLKFSYTAEIADVASGGLRHGVDYTHQIKLQGDFDGQTIAGLKGWSAHFTLLERAGRNASGDYLGDDLDQVQELYGSTKHAAAHLGEFYLEHVAGDDVTLDEKAGRLPVGFDFAWTPLFCQFLSLGLCPQPRGLTLNGGFTLDPSSTWGGRVKAASRSVYLMAGAYQVRPRYGGPSGFDWGFSHTTGAILPVEAAWTPRFGASQLQGHWKIGFAYDTSDYPDIRVGAGEHRQRTQLYLLIDQMVVRTGNDGTSGVVLLGGWAHGDPGTTIFRDYGYAGVAALGLIRSRPADSIQFLVTHGKVTGRLTAAQAAALATGGTLPTGFAPAPGSFAKPAMAPGVQTSETVVELNYGFHARTGVVLTPDLQFVGRPGGVRATPDALVLAARIEVNF